MILVFDIGTTVLKGALLSEEGDFISLSFRTLRMIQTTKNGYHEADPLLWKSSFREIVTELLAKSGAGSSIRAVAISGNGPTLVPVAEDGEFLNPVMTWMDRRGTAESAKISEYQDFYLDPTFYLPKALWLANNKPDIYKKTRHFLSCPESITYWLTGEAVTTLPGEHFQKFYWNSELLGKLGLDSSKFPGYVKPGSIVGKITRPGSKETGLPEGLPVVASGPDFIVSLLGTATVYPGRACDRAGTSEGINLCTESFITDPRIMCYEHVIEPLFNLSGIISTSGKAQDWIIDVFGCSGLGIEEFLEEIKGVPPGSDKLLFLPYLTGERAPLWDPAARGAFIGLGLSHGRKEMTRAVLESTGFAIRDVIEVMSENNSKIFELRITGGPSKSDIWNQLKADITCKNILVPESNESELLGDLALALHALGDSNDLAATADRLVRIKTVFEPRNENRRIYNEMFEMYRESYKGLKSTFNSLAKIKE
jgi:xylulokinase